MPLMLVVPGKFKNPTNLVLWGVVLDELLGSKVRMATNFFCLFV